MNGQEDGSERAAISESYTNKKNPGRMVRKGNWKYVWYKDGYRRLTDLQSDPEERVNLADRPEQKERVAQMQLVFEQRRQPDR